MKTRFLMAFATIAIAGLLSATTVQAEEKTPAAPAHAGMPDHAGMMNGQMKGHMDMSKMQEMMKDCMGKNKDGKMCDHEAMTTCQKDMKKGECAEMMKAARKESKK
jgi:hypothetical protein